MSAASPATAGELAPDAPRSGLRCVAERQPWATLIARGVKRVENRSSAMPSTLRGRWCAIYASGHAEPRARWERALELAGARSWPWPCAWPPRRRQEVRGAVVGLVRWEDDSAPGRGPRSRWRDRAAHGWRYSDALELAAPVPLLGGGSQSLVWILSDEVVARVLAAPARRFAAHARGA